MKNYTRKIKTRHLAAGELRIGAVIELRMGKFYRVVRIDLEAGWAYLLLLPAPKAASNSVEK